MIVIYQDIDDPPIRIQEESNVPHLAFTKFLLEPSTKLFKPFAGFIDIIYAYGYVTKSSSGFRVSIRVALEVWIGFSAVVVG